MHNWEQRGLCLPFWSEIKWGVVKLPWGSILPAPPPRVISHRDYSTFHFISLTIFFELWSSLPRVQLYINPHPLEIVRDIRLSKDQFLPARRYASAGYSDRNVSVRLSVTRRYCVKTKKASGMISSPSGSPKTLVFWRQISSPNSKGFPRMGASNKGRSEKFSDFLPLSFNIAKTVADTAKVTISH